MNTCTTCTLLVARVLLIRQTNNDVQMSQYLLFYAGQTINCTEFKKAAVIIISHRANCMIRSFELIT